MLAFLGFAGFVPFLCLLTLAPLFILSFVFWIWMLIDAIQNNGLGDGEKVGWVLAIVFLHFIAALLYLLIGRPKRHTIRPAQPPVMS